MTGASEQRRIRAWVADTKAQELGQTYRSDNKSTTYRWKFYCIDPRQCDVRGPRSLGSAIPLRTYKRFEANGQANAGDVLQVLRALGRRRPP